MAPRRNPEIVVVCLFEHGGHGYLAAPIVREVIKTYWDKRQPQKPPQLAAGQARTQSSLAP
jgi:cell division protein FtsI/penicillin-binding protein 2